MTGITECSGCPASKPPTSVVAPLAALPAESSVLLHSLTGQTALDGVAESIVLADIESVCASLTGPGSPPGKREPLSPKPGTCTGHNEPRERMLKLREIS